MRAGDPTPTPSRGLAGVDVEEVPALAEEISRRARTAPAEPSVTVSDLIGPRRAYWRRVAPGTPIAEERRNRMEAGRSAHGRLVAALPREGSFEVRVRRDGVAGRIDLLADVPVEVKTGEPVGVDHLLELRPDHVEQIAIYCALAERLVGRIVTLSPGPSAPLRVDAVDLEVPDPAGVGIAIRGRAHRIREAVRDRRPAELPRCRWYGRGCEFQEARVCDCDGSEPPPSTEILDRIGARRPRPEVAERWRVAIEAAVPDPGNFPLARFRDLLYPRRAYFEQTTPPPAGSPPSERAAPTAGRDLYDRLVAAVEGGPVGEVARLAPVGPGPEEEVAGFRGIPFLVRTSRAWRRLGTDEVVARFPQYALELGWRCAATGTTEGFLFLAFEHAERDADRFEVMRLRFRSVADAAAEIDRRAEEFRAAVAEGRPEALAPCPGWMVEGCPYRGSCGCDVAAERSQR